MVSCCICIEKLKSPVSLPCGHIFCTNCIVKAIRAVKHFTNFHPCPVCRSLYNIAPVNLKMVPPNLRGFVTPSIRRLYIDAHSPNEEEENDTTIASTSSEISRLQNENHALLNLCVMWQRRAEIQGSANLELIRLARTIQNRALDLVLERDELERHCSWLKHKLDGDESLTRGNATCCISHEGSVKTEEFLDPPLSFMSSFSMSPTSPASRNIPHSPSRHPLDGAIPPRKRLRIDSIPTRPQEIQYAGSTAEQISVWQTDSMTLP